MMLSHTTTDAPHEQFTIACDVCGDALDPGELDAPMGGWRTQREAYDAAEARGWQTDALEVGRDLCPAHVAGLA